jgi:hypothetical protein
MAIKSIQEGEDKEVNSGDVTQQQYQLQLHLPLRSEA